MFAKTQQICKVEGLQCTLQGSVLGAGVRPGQEDGREDQPLAAHDLPLPLGLRPGYKPDLSHHLQHPSVGYHGGRAQGKIPVGARVWLLCAQGSNLFGTFPVGPCPSLVRAQGRTLFGTCSRVVGSSDPKAARIVVEGVVDLNNQYPGSQYQLCLAVLDEASYGAVSHVATLFVHHPPMELLPGAWVHDMDTDAVVEEVDLLAGTPVAAIWSDSVCTDPVGLGLTFEFSVQLLTR